MSAQTTSSRQASWISLVFLLAAACALAFANGRWYVSAAAWLAPLFLLLFLDSARPGRGLAAAFVIQLLAFFFSWQGMIPVPGVWYYVITGIYAAVYFLPFVVHRLVAPRFSGFAATLVLPTSWVGIEFLVQEFVTPYGSWVSLAYTQVDRLWLLQLASVTGLSGISFLILWTAAVGAWVWRNRESLARVRLGLIVFGVVFLAVFVWGGVRVTKQPNAEGSLRVASLTPSARLTSELQDALQPLMSAPSVEESELSVVTDIAARINDDLLRRTRIEARAGADIVVWAEHAGRATTQIKENFIKRAQALASEFEIVLLMGVGVWTLETERPYENKLIAILPDGKVAWDYFKARPIAGRETSLIGKGDSEISLLDIGSRRFGAVICHDLDFPDFVRAAGREGVSILFGPSADWTEIATFHARMAMGRAVENGCYLVRPCSNGLSVVVDPLGRIVAASRDHGRDGTEVVAEIPPFELNTVYPRIGDLLAYICLIGMILLVVSGLVRNQRGQKT